jgi:AraC-like DNA-binding protein
MAEIGAGAIEKALGIPSNGRPVHRSGTGFAASLSETMPSPKGEYASPVGDGTEAEKPPYGHYAVAVTRLLEAAEDTIGEDPASARDCIARAIAILRPDEGAERRSRGKAFALRRSSALRGGLTPWQIRALADYIETNLSTRLRGADLARMAKLSGSYFTRAFKESFGETPHGYVMRRRVHHAETLMLTTDQPLGWIALACGFADQAHFCRWFLRLTGERPKSWRMTRRRLP